MYDVGKVDEDCNWGFYTYEELEESIPDYYYEYNSHSFESYVLSHMSKTDRVNINFDSCDYEIIPVGKWREQQIKKILK